MENTFDAPNQIAAVTSAGEATLLTVTDRDGDVIGRGLTAEEAAHEIMTQDGEEWDVRGGPGDWEVWTRKPVANIPWRSIGIFSSAPDREAAEAEIVGKILTLSQGWRGAPSVMTDAEYDEMIRQVREDNGE